MEQITEEILEEKTNYLLTYDLQQKVIDDLNKRAYSIKVSSWEDEESCKEARKLKTEIKKLFEKIDRRRIDLKKFIDNKGNAVTSLIEEPIKYLDSQLSIRSEELARQKREAEKAIQEVINQRLELLKAEGEDGTAYLLHPEACNEEKFQKILQTAKENRANRELKQKEEEAEREKQIQKDKETQEELKKLKAENTLLKTITETVQTINNATASNKDDTAKINAILDSGASRIDLAYKVVELQIQVSDLETKVRELTKQLIEAEQQI